MKQNSAKTVFIYCIILNQQIIIELNFEKSLVSI